MGSLPPDSPPDSPPDAPADSPPDDAEEWSDEQWLAWLVDTDVDEPGPPSPNRPARSRPVGSQLLYAAMFGVHQAIYGAPDQVTIVEEADGEPDEPQSLEVHLEPEAIDESTVVLRPWLMDDHEP
jgi:hypothetical protein